MRKTTKSSGEKIVKDIKRATRKHYSSRVHASRARALHCRPFQRRESAQPKPQVDPRNVQVSAQHPHHRQVCPIREQYRSASDLKLRKVKVWLQKLAEDVLADGASARQLFQEFASTLSTRESIRTQEKMERLTVAQNTPIDAAKNPVQNSINC
jgi:hypothetical protein